MKYRLLNEVLIEWNESSKEDSDNTFLNSEDIQTKFTKLPDIPYFDSYFLKEKLWPVFRKKLIIDRGGSLVGDKLILQPSHKLYCKDYPGLLHEQHSLYNMLIDNGLLEHKKFRRPAYYGSSIYVWRPSGEYSEGLNYLYKFIDDIYKIKEVKPLLPRKVIEQKEWLSNESSSKEFGWYWISEETGFVPVYFSVFILAWKDARNAGYYNTAELRIWNLE